MENDDVDQFKEDMKTCDFCPTNNYETSAGTHRNVFLLLPSNARAENSSCKHKKCVYGFYADVLGKGKKIREMSR